MFGDKAAEVRVRRARQGAKVSGEKVVWLESDDKAWDW